MSGYGVPVLCTEGESQVLQEWALAGTLPRGKVRWAPGVAE